MIYQVAYVLHHLAVEGGVRHVENIITKVFREDLEPTLDLMC